MRLNRVLLLICIFIYGLNANSLKITTDNWYPYVDNKLSNKGITTEIIDAIMEELKINYSLELNSFENGYLYTKEEKYDATFPYFKTLEREKEMNYSKSLLETENVLFYNVNNYNKNSLYNSKIGLINGYAYKNIDVNKFKNKIFFNNELRAFNSLNRGEIDLLPSNKLVGITIIKKYFNDFYTNIEYIKDKEFISLDTLHLISSVNSKNRVFMEKFNNALDSLKKSGKYDEILFKNQELLNPTISDYVRLVSNSSFPIVVASETLNSQEKYMLPTGTKAIVLEWSEYFKKPGIIKFYDEMLKKTKVRIINGPLKGKILYIENMYIQID